MSEHRIKPFWLPTSGILVLVLAACMTTVGDDPRLLARTDGPIARTATDAPQSRGTEFWLAMPTNYVVDPAWLPELRLFITSDTATNGVVEIPGLAFDAPFTVAANAVTAVDLPWTVQLDSSNDDIVEDKGIRVTANAPVSVYGLNRIEQTTDMYLGLPVDILGTEYINLGHGNADAAGSQFAVVATQDGTSVTIVPSVTTGSRLAGVPYDITLDQGQTYQLRTMEPGAAADLSGSIITSSKPVAVFGGHRCATVPAGYGYCDFIVEQLPPTTTWGQSFVTMPLKTRLYGDTFRVVASADDTQISVNGSPTATLMRGQVHEQIIDGPATVTSTGPVLLAQYSNGTTFDGITSDPFMMLIPPHEQFLATYTMATPSSGFGQNYLNVVAPDAVVGTLSLNGTPIDAAAFVPIGGSGFSGAQIDVLPGSHTLTAPLPFGVFSYGFDAYDSYGYPGGQSLAPVAIVAQLSLAPASASGPVNTQHCVIAAATDLVGDPVAGVRVDFSVSGANTASGFSNADPQGLAEFCYTGTAPGDDTIVAAIGTLVDSAVMTWLPGADDPSPDDPIEGLQGCGPGYWRSWTGAGTGGQTNSWEPTGYATADRFRDAFDILSSFEVRTGGRTTTGDPTLLEALAAVGGGGTNDLARQAVAALLNAAHPDVDFLYSASDVRAMVKDAIDGAADPAEVKDTLETQNQLGCPI